MGVSRVLVSSNKLGMVVEDEGLVTVNYKGGQVNKNQDQVQRLQYKGKSTYESQVLVRSSASQTVTFPEENKVQIVSTARQHVGVSRFLDQA